MDTEVPSFPLAQQAQIIRTNQRDLFHVSSLRQDTEAVVRSWLGTRRLMRWEKELDLLVKAVYYGLTTGRAIQTLGEEYTDIWQHSRPRLSSIGRFFLILLTILPSYLVAKNSGNAHGRFKLIPDAIEVLAEANLAIFYLKGTYYDLVKRVLGIKYISSIPENPHSRPPSYSLLGVLLAIRLLHRLVTFIRKNNLIGSDEATNASSKGKDREPSLKSNESFLDGAPISSILSQKPDDSSTQSAKSAEEDRHTVLSMARIPLSQRTGRNCTLCLEERTETTVTECGHLFCWSCIVSWGQEKAECPLCRQELLLTRLMPIYNL